MIFTELRFVSFFLVVFAVHWCLRGHRQRKLWLLACSYAFYAAWDWRFLSLILTSTVVDYAAGLGIARAATQRRRRGWLMVSLCSNLGLLGTFKYLGFLVDSAVDLLEMLGLHASRPSLSIILPVGISFYTFQTLSYTIDVYRGRIRPTRDFADLALFVAFFPQLVAGPIVRAAQFLPQLVSKRQIGTIAWRGLLLLFLVGYAKKACVADNVSQVVDAFYANPASHDLLGTWTALLLFSVQVYCDFSGYSDMAIACAGMLGYQLPLNFDFPLLASSIQEFWRRWHISLSFWLRDYVYFPLGGNRCAEVRACLNVMITLLLAGLWHGAAWTMAVFGLIHGSALVVRRQWLRWGVAQRIPVPLQWVSGIVLTYMCFVVSLVFFRSRDIGQAWEVLSMSVGLGSYGPRSPGLWPLAVFVGLALIHILAARRTLSPAWERMPTWAFALLYGALLPPCLGLLPNAVQPFVYFQF